MSTLHDKMLLLPNEDEQPLVEPHAREVAEGRERALEEEVAQLRKRLEAVAHRASEPQPSFANPANPLTDDEAMAPLLGRSRSTPATRVRIDLTPVMREVSVSRTRSRESQDARANSRPKGEAKTLRQSRPSRDPWARTASTSHTQFEAPPPALLMDDVEWEEGWEEDDAKHKPFPSFLAGRERRNQGSDGATDSSPDSTPAESRIGRGQGSDAHSTFIAFLELLDPAGAVSDPPPSLRTVASLRHMTAALEQPSKLHSLPQDEHEQFMLLMRKLPQVEAPNRPWVSVSGPQASDYQLEQPPRYREPDRWALQTYYMTEFSLLHLAAVLLKDSDAEYLARIVEATADVSAPAYCTCPHSISRRSNELQPFGSILTESLDGVEGRTGHRKMLVQAIHLAVLFRSPSVVSALLQKQARPDACATQGMIPDFTPLHLAVILAKNETPTASSSCGDFNTAVDGDPIVRLLLESHADCTAVDLRGVSPQMLAPEFFLGSPPTFSPDRFAEPTSEVRKGFIVGFPEWLCMEKRRHLLERRGLGDDSELSTFARAEFIVRNVEARNVEARDELTVELPPSQRIAMSRRLSRTRTDDQNLSQSLDMKTTIVLPRCSPLIRRNKGADGVVVYGYRRFEQLYVRYCHNCSGALRLSLAGEGGPPQTSTEEAVSVSFDEILDLPLPPQARYKNWVLHMGFFLHYVVYKLCAVDMSQAQESEVLKSILQEAADVNARAYHTGRSHKRCTTTALHLAAAMGCVQAASLLLEYGAPVLAMSTRDGVPYCSPLQDAAFQGHVRMVDFLLQNQADPNSPNIEGRTSLHLAVERNHVDIVRLLVGAKANVALRDEPAGGGRGLRPLDMCFRARKQYDPKTRAQVMALLAPSFNGEHSLFTDLSDMAMNSDVTGTLIEQALEEGWGEKLQELKRHALEGRIEGDRQLPVDHFATIIHNDPKAAVRMLNWILLDDPDIEDHYMCALPHRANLKPRMSNSWFWWRRHGWTVHPFLVDYQMDTNTTARGSVMKEGLPAGREHWPCWRIDQPGTWHWQHDLAPKPAQDDSLMTIIGDTCRGLWASLCGRQDDVADARADRSRGHTEGDSDVQVKVLLLANVLDVKVMMALARVEQMEVFAELPVQAILSCGFDKLCFHSTILFFFQESLLFGTFMTWSSGRTTNVWKLRWCWTTVMAVAIRETFNTTWWLCSHFSCGWSFRAFLTGWTPSFRIVRIFALWALVHTCQEEYRLDRSEEDQISAAEKADYVDEASVELFGRSFRRGIMGLNIIIQGIQFIFLLRSCSPEAEFGRHILSILHSFCRLWAIVIIMVMFFGSFGCAFIVMDKRMSWMMLWENVYRGLILGDGEGLDVMEGRLEGQHPHRLDVMMTVVATCVFTVCLLNVTIAVFTTEYERALKESYLLFWRHRARLCMQAMLHPRWPWIDEGADEAGLVMRLYMKLVTALADFAELALARAEGFVNRYSNLRCDRAAPEPFAAELVSNPPSELNRCNTLSEGDDGSREFFVGLVGWMLCGFCLAVGCILYLLRFMHAGPSAVFFGAFLVLLQSIIARNPHLRASSKPAGTADCENVRNRFYLWICYRANFARDEFLNVEVEKEHIDDLRNEMSLKFQGLNDKMQRLQHSLANDTGSDSEMPASPCTLRSSPSFSRRSFAKRFSTGITRRTPRSRPLSLSSLHRG